MTMYLCYDLKGIQPYIFQIPKLTCCIGGSRQVDSFDRMEVPEMKVPGAKLIYAGGGKGSFECENNEAMDLLKEKLIKAARAKGLTIRFGFDADYTKAAGEINETYCYQPDSLEGHPCALSGQYPTTEPDGIHPLIRQREELGRQKGMESATEKGFLGELRKLFNNDRLSFFYNVNALESRDGEEGALALGNRNRWAAVCMDGNEMGMQYLAFKKLHGADNAAWSDWLPKLSKSLDECTRSAALEGMKAVTEQYLADFREKGERCDTLPLRPLIVGGDDVTVLVSCKYAILFVKTVMEAFRKASRACKDHKNLWVGTNGELTISGGILFAPVSLPLHSVLSYAEQLLASAKTHGRTLKNGAKDEASPACLDWESVTEGLLDSPAERRQREFQFTDFETGNQIKLTARPYALNDEFKELEKVRDEIAKVPKNILYQFHPALREQKAKRLAFYARIGKNYPSIQQKMAEKLDDVISEYGEWWKVKDKVQKTRLIDAVLLMQEDSRMEKETVYGSDENEDI